MDFKKRPYKRNERLSKEIKIILSDFILKTFNLDGSGIITISKVNISRDLRNAKVYFSVIDNQISKDDLIKELNKKSKFVKGIIGKQITSKNIPDIAFYFDDSIEYYDKLDRMFLDLDE
jgi:ribosome-binding factor A